MASLKLSALPSLGPNQVPTDLLYIDDVSAGAAGSKSITPNDLVSTITRNITDGAVRFQGFAAPALSGAGAGAIYFDSTANAFRVSENAGAYRAIGDVTGPAGATDEALVRFDGATGKILQNSLITLSDLGALTFPDNVRQTFNPGVTVAGLNVGALAGDPSAPINGDLWYDSTGNLLRARINGATISLGGSTPPGGGNTQVQYNNGGAFGGVTGFTSDGTNVTAGDGNLRATSPLITTSIDDANGNIILGLSPVGASVNQFTIANAAVGGNPTISTTGADADIPFIVTPKGTARLESTGPLRLSGAVVDQFVTPIGNSIPTKINIPLFDPGSFGQVLALGLASGIAASARVITVCDQRAAGHQPSIALLSVDESNIFGMSWDGQNSIGYLINTTGEIGVQGRFRVESGGVALAIFDNTANAYFGNGIVNAAPASYVLNATGGSGTNIAGANLDLAGGKGTGNAISGMVAIRYPLIGASGTTLQSLSTDRFPPVVSLYSNIGTGTAINNTTAETSLFTGLTGSAGSTATIQGGISRQGTLYKIRIFGNVQTTGTPTLQVIAYLGGIGGSIVFNTGAATMQTVNGRFWLDIDLLITAIGAAGSVSGFGKLQYSSAGAGAITLTTNVGANVTSPIDFTANQAIDVSITWGTANANNSIQVFGLSVTRER